MPRIILLAIFTIALYEITSSSCCVCPPGFGLILPCEGENSTTCVPCQLGHSFSDGSTECQSCSKCPFVERHACNLTRNSACANCDRDYYWDGEICRQCTLCPHGTGAVSPCGQRGDTECRACPVGFFSDVLSHGADCVHCSTCKENQAHVLNCTSIHDTVCADRGSHLLRPYRRPPAQSVEVGGQLPESPSGKDSLPLYCALLGGVVLGLLIYVLIKKKRSTDSNKLIRHEERSACNNVLIEARISDVSASKRTQLENLLNTRRNDQRDWRGLARQLGYGTSLINYLQAKGEKSKLYARQLLVQLDKDGHSVTRLIEALLSIGRADAALVLNHHGITRGDIV